MKEFLQKWWIGVRPKTLPAAFVPVLVGSSVAYFEEGFIVWRSLAALGVALSLQIATNLVNDYADGARGVDNHRVGPKRLVASGVASKQQVQIAAGCALISAGLIGLSLVFAVGYELLLLGAVCIVAAWAYTGGVNPYGYKGLGEIFVFVFFGLVATVGTNYVNTESISSAAVLISFAVGFLSVNLLVANNLRDIKTDKISKKNTLAVMLGDHKTRNLYLVLIVLAMVSVLISGAYTMWAWLGLAGFVQFISPAKRILNGAQGVELIAVLEKTSLGLLLVGLLVSIGFILGA